MRAEASARLGEEAEALAALNRAREGNRRKHGCTYEALTPQDFLSGDYAATSLLQEILDETYLAYIASIEAFNFVRRVGLPPHPDNGQLHPPALPVC